MTLQTRSIGNLESFDDNAKSALWIGVQSAPKEKQVFLALSLEKNGDLEITLHPDDTRALIELLENALDSLNSQSQRG